MGEGVSTISKGSRIERNSGRLSAQKQNADMLMSSRRFKSAITRAHNYTDGNYHGEARRTVAKAFGYNDLADEYSKVIKEHNRAGYLTEELYERRTGLDDEMAKRIRRDFGERGLREYQRGLT